MSISDKDPMAVELSSAIKSGNLEALQKLLHDDSSQGAASIVDSRGVHRTLLHIASDWPGHYPNARAVVTALVKAGADPNAQIVGTNNHAETPLHWAASSDDVDVIDALLDNGANIEMTGAIFTNGTPMSDAVIFAQWKAARRLLERGAKTTFWQAAALGLLNQVQDAFAAPTIPTPEETTMALWHACRGTQRNTAEYLLARGANINWIGWDKLTPLAGASKTGNAEFIDWLRSQGAKLTHELS